MDYVDDWVEPFRIKVVEPIKLVPREERIHVLENASFNVFKIPSEYVFIDLLTDSGTGAMSQDQWAELIKGDEAYAGSRSWFKLREVLAELTGKKYIFPVHQGRAAERILFNCIPVSGKVFISNGFFDTTRANLMKRNAIVIDCPITSSSSDIFAGNMDITGCMKLVEKYGKEKIGGILLTLTNNTYGGQPVSLKNVTEARKLCDKLQVPLLVDIARIAENTYFIHKYEYPDLSPWEIAKEICRLADFVLMSAKKDGLVNIGGFLAMDNEEIAELCRQELISGEGFTDYGGLAGRDMAALAVGIRESFDIDYLEYRIEQVWSLGFALEKVGMPVIKPFGGHAIYIDAGRLYNNIPPEHLPGIILSSLFYIEGGIRVSDLGSLAFGEIRNNQIVKPAPRELVRLAIPRRVYTESHLRWVVKTAEKILSIRPPWKGFRIKYAPEKLAHFTAELEPIL